MALALLGDDGAQVSRAELPERLAAQEIKPHLIHQTVVAELAARRSGTHSTRNRALVRGGGAKPWRQKGTGRARQGSTRAPQWTGGGVVFGPTPRSHGGKVNKKIREQAFRSALRAHADRDGLALMDPSGWDTPSTRRAKAYLAAAPAPIAARPLLVVLEDADGPVGRSFRNLEGVYVLSAREIEVVDLMAGRSLLVQRSVWERWAGEVGETTPQTAPAAAPRQRAPRMVKGPKMSKAAAPAPAPEEAPPAQEPADQAPAAETPPAEAEGEAAEAAADDLAAVADETDEAEVLAEAEDDESADSEDDSSDSSDDSSDDADGDDEDEDEEATS